MNDSSAFRQKKKQTKKTTNYSAMYKMVWIVTKGFTKPKKKKKKRNWVSSAPNRRNKAKYKMFPFVLSGCSTGSLETCTHIISIHKTYSLFVPNAETYYFIIYFYMGICVGFEQTIKHKILHSLPKYYNELRTADLHKMASMFHQTYWQFCND